MDYLKRYIQKEAETGLAYIYGDFGQRNHEPETLLASLWTQLLLQRELSKAEIDQLHNELYARRIKLSRTELNSLVENEFKSGKFQRTLIVIDALDECAPEQREVLVDQVSRLYPWANVLITSRVTGIDLERFTDSRKLEIISAPDDMRLYINSRIIGSPLLAKNFARKPALRDEIIRTVIERARNL